METRNDTLRMSWWRLCLPQMAQTVGHRVRVYRRLEMDGWCGLCVCNQSGRETSRIDGWWKHLGEAVAVRLPPEPTFVRHPIAGGIMTESAEFFFRDEDALRDMERFLNRIPARVHEIEVGREAVPAMRTALRGMNWHVYRGNEARLLTVQDSPYITAIKTLAAMSKA